MTNTTNSLTDNATMELVEVDGFDTVEVRKLNMAELYDKMGWAQPNGFIMKASEIFLLITEALGSDVNDDEGEEFWNETDCIITSSCGKWLLSDIGTADGPEGWRKENHYKSNVFSEFQKREFLQIAYYEDCPKDQLQWVLIKRKATE